MDASKKHLLDKFLDQVFFIIKETFGNKPATTYFQVYYLVDPYEQSCLGMVILFEWHSLDDKKDLS